MSNKVCKFYAQGACSYGSSCRFLHSDNIVSNYQYNNKYQPRYSKENKEHGHATSYNNDYNEQRNKYHNVNKNNIYYSKDYNNRNNYNQKDKYTENYNHQIYDNRDNYQKQNHHNLKNYYYSNEDSKIENYKDKIELGNQLNEKNKNYEVNLNRNTNFEKKLNYKQSEKIISKDKQKCMKQYENEIKALKTQMNGLISSTIWPLTCFHPIGHSYPIQSVGSLNLPDVSFEELRCDYYLSKNISANPGQIHKKLYDDLLLKSHQQKKSILSLSGNVLDDLIATFDKCQQSKTNSTFQNTLDMDENEYWNMSIKHLMALKDNKTQLESFSFVNDKNEPKTDNDLPEIFMQHDIYGTVDSEEFEQEYFTNFIPILPPPKKFCF